MTNEFVNKNHWDISKYQDLTWKLCAAVGTGIPTFHQYLPAKKIELDKFEKLLGELNPSMKLDDIKMLASMMDDTDREELFDKMGFDKKILELSRTIYQTSVIAHGTKQDPSQQIDKIRGMIREFIRTEVVPYELTNSEKMSFILKNEAMICEAIGRGHKANDQDEFQKTREKIKKYRIELGIL